MIGPRGVSVSATDFIAAISAVIAARGRKYVMMNAPANCLPELEALLPALESPTVIPLAHRDFGDTYSASAPYSMTYAR